jgi:hypothetical protein
MDKYFKIQKLVDLQKERKDGVEKVFESVLKFLSKMEIDFRFQNKLSYKNLEIESVDVDFLVKVKLKDRSSVKFIVKQNQQKIIEEYSKLFPKDILIIVY